VGVEETPETAAETADSQENYSILHRGGGAGLELGPNSSGTADSLVAHFKIRLPISEQATKRGATAAEGALRNKWLFV
jgi:hypothetical protein